MRFLPLLAILWVSPLFGRGVAVSTSRGEVVSLSASYPEYVNRWAVIVGISNYKAERLNLKYADRDAEALYGQLTSPSGGGFQPDHIIKLLNKEATTAEITRALRTFLKKPAKEDIVLIYFAAHGSPDPERPSNIYLLTYDTDPNDISGTALPMREVQSSLRENLLAERVILLADTCHSAAVTEIAGTRASDNTALVNRYLEEVSRTKPGTALMTSAENNELAREDIVFGGGHGVFTHFILEGMRGEADRDRRDGVVTVGELFDYVRDKVKDATNNKQHPSIGPAAFDRTLPMAITGNASAQELYRLGRGLYGLGLKLKDQRRLVAAISQLEEAIKLSRTNGQGLPEAQVLAGRSLLAINDLSRAERTFQEVLRQDNKTEDRADALFLLGLTYLKMPDTAKAASTFERFLTEYSKDERAPWVSRLVEKGLRSGKKYALLIGAGKHKDPRLLRHQLLSSRIDVEKMAPLLRKRFDFEVTTLIDEAATTDAIVAEFGRFAKITTPQDSVLIYYSGMGSGPGGEEPVMLYDYSQTKRLTADELHRLIISIPTRSKTVLLDTMGTKTLAALARRSADYELFLGSGPDEFAFDLECDGVPSGVLTCALLSALREFQANDFSDGDLFDATKKTMALANKNQHPVFIGNPRQLFTGFIPVGETVILTDQKNREAFEPERLRMAYQQSTNELGVLWPAFHQAIGEGFLDKELYEDAEQALGKAADTARTDNAQVRSALAVAQMAIGKYDSGLKNLRSGLEASELSQTVPASVNAVQTLAEGMATSHRKALLVGIGRYLNPKLQNPEDPATDVKDFKQLLLRKFGFDEKEITVLLDANATRQNILKEFEGLVEATRYQPGLFYFKGLGSHSEEDLGIVPADSSRKDVPDIRLSELARIVGTDDSSLVSVFDSRFTENLSGGATTRGFELNDKTKTETIGTVSLFPPWVSVDEIIIAGSRFLKEVPDRSFTANLIEELEKTKMGTSYRDLSSILGKKAFISSDSDQPLLAQSKSAAARLWNMVKNDFEEPELRDAAAILERNVERRNGIYPQGLVNLGVIYAELGEDERSLSALEKAIQQTQDANTKNDAQFHLGRILYQNRKDLGHAVDALRSVHQQEPENAAAAFYFGQAIRVLVEQNLLQEAEQSLRTYIEQGAPNGHTEEVNQFLTSRPAPGER